MITGKLYLTKDKFGHCELWDRRPKILNRQFWLTNKDQGILKILYSKLKKGQIVTLKIQACRPREGRKTKR